MPNIISGISWTIPPCKTPKTNDVINKAGKMPKSLFINVKTTRLKTISSMTGARKTDATKTKIFPPVDAESRRVVIGEEASSPK